MRYDLFFNVSNRPTVLPEARPLTKTTTTTATTSTS